MLIQLVQGHVFFTSWEIYTVLLRKCVFQLAIMFGKLYDLATQLLVEVTSLHV